MLMLLMMMMLLSAAKHLSVAGCVQVTQFII